MARSLRVLGLTLVAALAMSAVVASAAHATQADLTLASETGTVKVEEDPNDVSQVFKVPGLPGSVTCNNLEASGDVTEHPQPDLTLEEIKYTGCNYAGFNASVNFNGCHYYFHDAETIEEGVATGLVDVVGSCEIVISAAGVCTIKVKPSALNTNLGSITYTEVIAPNGKEAITVDSDVEKIHATYSGFFCGSGTSAESTYEGKSTATGFDTAGKPTDLTLADTE